MHYESTNPAAIGTAPNVVASPTISAWPTDTIVIRAILDAASAMRATGIVAFTTTANWGT